MSTHGELSPLFEPIVARFESQSHALAHLGVRHIDMPLTAERVWTAIQQATAPSTS